MICSSSNGRGHLYIVPMDDTKGYCDFDSENIIEINGLTSKYFDEDGSIKTMEKACVSGCIFIPFKPRLLILSISEVISSIAACIVPKP